MCPMQRFCLSIIAVFLIPSCVFAQEVRTADDLIAAVKRKDAHVWQQFSDFDKVLAQMNGWETKLYEEAHGGDFSRTRAQSEILGDEKRVVEFDQMAFLKAYPHLSAAFERSDVRWRFEQDFVRHYSFGWKRMMALRRGQLAILGQRFKPGAFRLVRLDETKSFILLSDEDVKGLQGMWNWHLSLLTKLAVCQGYSAAIRDIIKRNRIEKDLALSPLLSYLLWVRAKQKGVPFIDEASWQAEIDKGLAPGIQKRYKNMTKGKTLLAQRLRFCSE